MLDFLLQPAGFDIGETGLMAYNASQPLWAALLVGLGNTLRVALPALFMATILGVCIALARRSESPPARWLATGLVESVRNVPLLVQLLLWYFVLVEWLPDSNAALNLMPGVWLSKGGLAFPWPWSVTEAGVRIWQWSVPVQAPFNVDGGASVTPEYLAVAWSLSIYTAAFFSEVVRGALESVHPSLAEAARTLGARPWQVFFQVVLPEALRAMVPAATNQYLNLIKNSSLAVAVGYPDLVSVGNTALNQTGRAVECIGVMMAVYLSISLLTSWLMNVYNRKQALLGGAS
jgi:general L-amino acid transport system permease protein